MKLIKTHVHSEAVASYGTSAMYCIASKSEVNQELFKKANVQSLLRTITTRHRESQAEENARDLQKLLLTSYGCQCVIS